jgi:rhomboid protease GluP
MGTTIRSTETTTRAEEWALVLASAGVPCRLEPSGRRWMLIVLDEDVGRAGDALDAFDIEESQRTAPVRIAVSAERPMPWVLGVVAGTLLLTGFAITGPPTVGSYWFERGAAVASLMRAEPWRAVTALTLHLDIAHVAGNAVAMALLLPAVGHRLGVGAGTASVLLAGAVGNLLAALVQAPGHATVGASTANFAAIGMLGTLRLFSGSGDATTSRKAWTVPAASLLLLTLLGAGRGADVLAHAFGFLSGAVLGLPTGADRQPFGPAVQWAFGVLAAAVVAGCWLRAVM